MKPPFRLDQHLRRGVQPLSNPPAGYFDQLPTRIMAQVAVPAHRPLLVWLWQAPMYVRTGLASTVLLGTFAASMWLGSAPLGVATPAVTLDAVPQQQLVEYLTSGETHVDMLDLAELPTRQLGITRQYLKSSPTELTEALDAQPAEDGSLL
ncbi:hypothetical protein E4631_17840 [Hymenobacter sp. UV11]|uniref:hypothetical protein n=1 Tax=Hymenobacter sp. UV11 TaxID=1849735 RepID=UPI001061F2E8|nr:hypothetical protein [Hymenobacter sp. UV11]TDN40166.1 hypothetical protein A8B98_14850 [Hymenobacter sp. UV11]TFZ64850.1 hypothetical protein E4631_17840 [Hymenobacter sp. UV11]